ncbi:Macrolide export protein MacA [Myxococcaceae bacterium]|jgi:HlyD family secretion protein|nr:Macrolide export protein MacA [Myxococcaceae bacterium]
MRLESRRRWSRLALAALAAVACSGEGPPAVSVAEARPAPLRVAVVTNGKVEPVDESEVRARLDGRVVEIPDPGSSVRQGEPLVRLDGSAVASGLASAESERLAARESLRAAGSEVEAARRRFETDQELFRQGAITRERFIESEIAFRDARERAAALAREVPLRTEALDFRIRELAEQRDAAQTPAPVTGTVYRTDVKRGALVRKGDLLLAIADLERLRVRANIDQVDLGRVRPGARVVVTSNAFPGREWSGSITEIVPNVIVKENRAVSEGLAVLERPLEGLVPGMTVDVEIIVAESPRTLVVPADAVVRRGADSVVYLFEDGRVRERAVRTGLSSVTAVEIVEGLSEGDVVVVSGAAGLEDGARVEARKPDARTS